MKDVFDDHRSEDIEFKVTIGTTNSNCNVVTHNLSHTHGDSFTLGRVDLTGHNGTSRLIFRKQKFTETTSGARTQESDIVGNLIRV